MSVRFIIGRAGVGKSTSCAKEIRAAMAKEPLGGALLWITPEQATFTAERMLLGGSQESEGGSPKGVGTFRAQVVSFRRLASLIGEEVGFLAGGGGRAKPLGDLARLVLLEETVRGVRGELRVFGAVADRPGFIKKLDSSLRELRQHAQSGDSLRAMAGREGLDALAGRKFLDLAVLLDAWSKVVDAEGNGAWDSEAILHRAALSAGESPMVTGGARVWIDGFSGMSALEIRMVVALAQHAEAVTITLLADPDAPAIRDLRCAPEEMTLFGRTERLYCQLMDAFRTHKVRLSATTRMRTARRFENELLKRVEGEMFFEGAMAAGKAAAGGSAQASFGFAASETPEGAVELWECSDPETEVRVAAQAIREMVVEAKGAGGGLRYRQIALIVPDLEGYGDAIGRIFSEHKIPHFIDQRKTVAHHPLVELLRSAVAIETSHWDQDEVLLYLKTGLAGVAAEDVAVVENYVLGHGITHVAWGTAWQWVAPNEEEGAEAPEHARALLARVNYVRAEVWAAWQGARAELAAGGAEVPAGSVYVRWLRALLAGLKVEGQLEGWIRAAQGADGGGAEIAQMHEQVWRQTQELLATLEQLLEGRARTVGEFARVLNDALESLTLGLIPPTVDQVLVSSVTRSRVPAIKVGMILGAVEGQFPKVAQEDPILSDAQRDFFNRHSAEPIGAGTERQLLEMPFFDYTAFTRASERLIVSYPVGDRAGRAVARSRYVQQLMELLGGQLVMRKFDAASRTAIDRMGTVDDLLASVAMWARDLRRRETMEEKAGADDRAMTRVYNWLVGSAEPALVAARELVWQAMGEKGAPQLALEIAQRFYPPGRELRMSVSQLEKFASCPMQYFMHYTLGLRQRSVLEMDTLNLGNLYHRILENVYREIMDHEIAAGGWPACETFNLRAALEREVEAACEALHKELAERTPAYDKMKARTKRVLGIVLEGERRRACVGDMRPVGTEVTFGGSAKEAGESQKDGRIVSLPVLRIETAAKHAVALNGKIDRVDAAREGEGKQVAVVDYKSASEKTLPMYLVYWGLALQLPVYALVMEKLAGRESMAAMYLSLGLKRETVRQFSDAADPASDLFYQGHNPRGVVDAEHAHHLDGAVGSHEDGGGTSAWYAAGWTKEHRPLARSDMVEHGEYRTLLEYIPWKIGRMVDELMEGRIAPAPYRDKGQAPCEECEFASLCPFDRVNGAYRDVPKMKRDEALARMRADVAGGVQ